MDALLIFAKLNDLRLINRAGGLYGPVGNIFVGGEYHDPTLTQFVMYCQYFLPALMPALTFTLKLLV